MFIHLFFFNSITFNRVAVNMNIAAVKKIVDLAKEMKNLEVYLKLLI